MCILLFLFLGQVLPAECGYGTHGHRPCWPYGQLGCCGSPDWKSRIPCCVLDLRNESRGPTARRGNPKDTPAPRARDTTRPAINPPSTTRSAVALNRLATLRYWGLWKSRLGWVLAGDVLDHLLNLNLLPAECIQRRRRAPYQGPARRPDRSTVSHSLRSVKDAGMDTTSQIELGSVR